MTPIQQLFLGAGGAKKKVYMDDVFSTYPYEGHATGASQAINNGINLSGEGGLVWLKQRNGTYGHYLIDTVRGSNQTISSDSNAAQSNPTGNALDNFLSNGFTVGGAGQINNTDDTYASWSFRKAKGFFDVVTWTGNGTGGRQIAHSLGSVPGCIMVKCTSDASTDWRVYHRSIGNGKALELNGNDAEATTTAFWNDTDPTSTHFTVGTSLYINGSSKTYVAYVFAGGESTAATANSVDFDGSGDYLTTNSSSDYTPGTGDFTLEYWYNPDENAVDFIVDASAGSEVWSTYCNAGGFHKYYVGGTDRIVSTSLLRPGQWHHIAVVRISGTVTMYINGKPEGGTYNDTNNYTFNALHIGRRSSYSDHEYNGKISNLRYIVGTGIYTSAFKPPTEPLTNITNTKLLCCNSSSVTGATVGTINSNGDPTASTDSPFDDPAAFTFGEEGDQGIIKCGSYIAASGDENINLGFEPQWVMIKSADYNSPHTNWHIYDSMRGVPTGGNTATLSANLTEQESGGTYNYDEKLIEFTSTGFIADPNNNNWGVNGNANKKYVYMAIRRPDGYVGKPADAATDVFAIDGTPVSTEPNFESGFPVDFGLVKLTGGSGSWTVTSRLLGTSYLNTDTTGTEGTGATNYTFDLMDGMWKAPLAGTTYQAWMWKRHTGFDLVTYDGNGASNRALPHSLSKSPEMMWVKNRDSGSENWVVYHKDLAAAAGGTDSETDYLVLNSDASYGDHSGLWNDTAPTATHFTVGNHSTVNHNGHKIIVMLFASVDGISKVGSYTGTGAAWSGSEVTCGFQPRFIIIKRTDGSRNWCVYDTLRGIDNQGGGTEEKILFLNEDDAQDTAENITLSSTGFTFPGGSLNANASSGKYIFYAHA